MNDIRPWIRTTPSGFVTQRSSNSLDGCEEPTFVSRRLLSCEGGNRTHLGPVNSRVPDRQASSQSPPWRWGEPRREGLSRCTPLALGRRRGASHDQVFREHGEAFTQTRGVPLVEADGCQSWVRTRAFRVRAGDPSTGPTGKTHDHQGMSCRTWIRTRASRVKAGHPDRWTIRQRREHHCPRPAPRERAPHPNGTSRGVMGGSRGT